MSLDELLRVCTSISKRNLSLATTGNFSIRIDEKSMQISCSGKDKSLLQADDFVTCDLAGKNIVDNKKPSAEAPLHGMIYQLLPDAMCVLHTHSVPATVLSMLHSKPTIDFTGYEMQKTIQGISSHTESLSLKIYDNDQDMHRLALQVYSSWEEAKKAYGILLRGHGIYSWGSSVSDAKRHMEGLEFLLECELMKRKVA